MSQRNGFTKLMSSLTASSIWSEDDQTRIVWITMLAMSDSDGYVGAAIPGIAAIARVPVEAAERAIEKFLAPDKYSRSPDHEGRRIEVAERGWRLLNHANFRDSRGEERKEYQRGWVKRKRMSTPVSTSTSRHSTNTDTDTDTDTDLRTQIPTLRAGRARGVDKSTGGHGLAQERLGLGPDPDDVVTVSMRPAVKPGAGKSIKRVPVPNHPETKAAIDGYHQLFLAARGVAPTWDGREIKRVNALVLRAGGADAVLERARTMFACAGSFPVEHGGDLVCLTNHFDRFASAPPGKRTRDPSVGPVTPATAYPSGRQKL